MLQVILTPVHDTANEHERRIAAPIAEPERQQLTVHVSAVIVAEAAARRAANGWLGWDVGERLAAGQPELVLSDKLVWRIPVKWTSPTRCVLVEKVCDVFVDALTGEVLNKDATTKEIHRNVEHAARAIPSTVRSRCA